MKVFYSPTHRQHAPPFEIFDGGEKITNFEMPERVERILSALRAEARYEIVPPEDFGLGPIEAVHDRGYLRFLQTAFDEWLAEDTDYERTALLPATFPLPGPRGHVPTTLLGRAGYYMTDLSAPIVSGTYAAALASANCALSGAKALAEAKGPTTGQKPSSFILPPSSFALCRPPGHHAGRANCAGYCYINNAAVTAGWLAQFGPVTILDIDYHAGNGTQDIFYERADVLTISIHADPNFEYPYYSGYADQTGAGAGLGFHQNYPLALGTDDAAYLSTLEKAIERISLFQPAFLVVSAGMDIYGEDPLGRIRITREGIRQIGQKIAALNLPTLAVMEGGYNNEALGLNVCAFLEAFHYKTP
ncbi:MAG: histone deacetylase family protein [Anaerolineae bacterium]|nr:histone deacetylase family protein [Anaerolineae bacterium]